MLWYAQNPRTLFACARTSISPSVRFPSKSNALNPILTYSQLHMKTHAFLASKLLISFSLRVPLKSLSPEPPGKSGGGLAAKKHSR